MQSDNEELPKLKEIYDELWSDAKTLAKDLSKSISIYVYASYLTWTVSFVIVLSFIANFVAVLAGSGGVWEWFNLVMGATGTIVTIVYGAKLFQWYRQLKRRYSKLIKLEKELEEK